MKNTKMRKKMLISSIAMLMVATVSLGSATYAWFSANTKATASTISAKTSQSSNLELSVTGTGGWTDKLEFSDALANAASLDPATTADFSIWQTGKANGIDTGIASGALTTASAPDNYLTTPLYVKYGNAGGSGKMNIKVVITATPKDSTDGANDAGTANFLRVALVPKTMPEGKTHITNAPIVYGNNKDDFGKDPSKFTALDAANENGQYSMVTNVTNTIALGELQEGVVYGYDVYVWYEGTDPQCIDSNSVNTIPVSFSFEKV
ncbi:MAG: hypothetical protein ACI4IS_00520 [Acutalibacteraceae bacterium]